MANTTPILFDINCDPDGVHCGECTRLSNDGDACLLFGEELNTDWDTKTQATATLSDRCPACLLAARRAKALQDRIDMLAGGVRKVLGMLNNRADVVLRGVQYFGVIEHELMALVAAKKEGSHD